MSIYQCGHHFLIAGWSSASYIWKPGLYCKEPYVNNSGIAYILTYDACFIITAYRDYGSKSWAQYFELFGDISTPGDKQEPVMSQQLIGSSEKGRSGVLNPEQLRAW